MGRLVANESFRPGMRFSPLDGLALMIGALAIVATISLSPELAALMGIALGHFFLFRNVFRIRRSSELLWATVFVTLAGGTLLSGTPGWPWTLSVSFGLSLALILLEMRSPSYHGLGWRIVNPGLESWWNAHKVP